MAIVFASLSGDLIAVSVILVTFCVFYVIRKFTYWQRLGFDFIPPQFPFGNFKETFLQRKSPAELIVDLYRANDAPLVGIWTVLRPTLLVRDPEAIRSILIKDFAKFQDRGVYCDEKRDPLSGHLFALPGEKWRHLRQKLSPTFTSGKLKAMFSTLVGCGQPLTEHMSKQADGSSVVEIRELLAQFTTNIIASVAFGLDIDCIADPETDFRRFGRQVFAPTVRNGVRAAIQIFFPSVMALSGLKTVDRDVDEFFMSVVRQNLEHREKGNVTRKDFFQLLVQLRNNGLQEDGVWETKIAAQEEAKQLSVNECAAQSFVFYLAGFETSSTTSSFALYEFAKNPEIQKRVQEEIDEVLQRHGGEVTYESVAEMKYLEACIDETLRKYPPIPVLNRTSSVPWTVPNSGGRTLEAGTPIIIPVYALQHDPQYYPNPDQFEPERFMADHLDDKNSVSSQRPYLPFGDGPRNCIGLRLGKIQTKVGLITMLQRYWYDLAGNTKLPLKMEASSFVLTPVGGINLRVSHRK